MSGMIRLPYLRARSVIPGLDPGIHAPGRIKRPIVSLCRRRHVDGRVKPEDDAESLRLLVAAGEGCHG